MQKWSDKCVSISAICAGGASALAGAGKHLCPLWTATGRGEEERENCLPLVIQPEAWSCPPMHNKVWQATRLEKNPWCLRVCGVTPRQGVLQPFPRVTSGSGATWCTAEPTAGLRGLVLAWESQGGEKKSPTESSCVPRELSAGSRRSLPVLHTPLSSNFEVDLLNNSNKLMCPV